MSNVKWLIVDTCCGLGNHLLMNVRGLMMALRMRRAITFLEESDLAYDMASVLPIIPMTVPAALGWPHTSTKVFATDYRDGHIGATLLMCGDWDALLSFRFLQVQGLSDVHVSMLVQRYVVEDRARATCTVIDLGVHATPHARFVDASTPGR